MNASDAWKGLVRVPAPPDFEDRVLRDLHFRLKPDPQVRKARTFKWALSGSAAVLLLAFTVLNLFVFKNGPAGPAAGLASGDPIHIIEPLNYGHEVRSASDSRTVYILEQVSDASSSKMRF